MATIPDERRLLRAREVAAMLDVCVDTVYRAASTGKLTPVRLGDRGWLKFNRSEVEEIIRGRSR